MSTKEELVKALSGMVTLLLDSAVPIGPMRSRADYPSELRAAIAALHTPTEQPAEGETPDEFIELSTALWDMEQERNAARAEVERLRGEVAAIRKLYQRAFNCAAALTNYCEDRPGLRRVEKDMAAIEEEYRAAPAAPEAQGAK